MKKLLLLSLACIFSFAGYSQISQATKLIAGSNISLNQAGNTYTVNAGISTGTVTVPNGGTGKGSFTAYAVITGGTTSTGALQNVSGLGTSGQVLTSAGAGALPTWTTLSSGLTVGTTPIASGTSPYILYNNAGVLGNIQAVPIANGGTNNTSAYTAGSVIFSNGTSLTQDNSNFFWNDASNYAGIGSNTITATLGVRGATSSDAANHSLKIQDALSAPMLYVNNNRQVSLNTADAYMILNVFGGGLFGGVGSVAPTSGSSVAAIGLRVGNTDFFGTSASLDFGSNGSTYAWMQSTNSTDYSLRYPLMINPNGGFVGIGVTTATAKLHVQGTNNDWTSKMVGGATAGQSYGQTIYAGTNSSDISFEVKDVTNTNFYFSVRGDGQAGVGIASASLPSSTRFSIQGSGTGISTYALKVNNSTPAQMMYLTDNGRLQLQATGSQTHAIFIGSDGTGSASTGDYNTIIGESAFTATGAGNANTGMGQNVLDANTSGTSNAAFGTNALYQNTTGSDNTAMGYTCLTGNAIRNCAFGSGSLGNHVSGDLNVAVGWFALATSSVAAEATAIGASSQSGGTTGLRNTSIGYGSLATNTTGSNNTALGHQAGFTNSGGSGNVFIGYQAGYRQVAVSNKLFIDNTNWASAANESDSALVNGTFGVLGERSIQISGALKINSKPVVTNSSTSGNVTFSQPIAGTTYKKVILYLNASTGTTSYTFPVAFTNTPVILTTSGLAAGVITALSTTAVTTTGAATTGFLFIEGY